MAKRNIVLGFLIIGLCLILIMGGIDVSFSILLTVWLLGILYATYKPENKILLIFFLISFFVFLISGHLVYEFLGMELKYYFGDEYYIHSNVCMTVSLAALLMAFYVKDKFVLTWRLKRTVNSKKIINEDYKTLVQNVSLFFFLITYVFWIYLQIDVLSFVTANSYSEYYTDYTSSAPTIVQLIGGTTPYFFYLFLATMPTKRKTALPCLLYLIYGVLGLLSGKRGNFVFLALFIVLYFVLRQYTDKEVWIKKSYIVIGVIGIPLFLAFLYMYNYIRSGESIANVSVIDMFFGFFQQQGFSSSILRLEMKYRDQLTNNPYSFWGITKYIHTNSIIKLFYHPETSFSYTSQNVGRALYTNSLSDALSYIALGNKYLNGNGVGSCYIAELYTDAGYIGVVLGSAIYGVIINTISKTWKKFINYSPFTIAVGFAMVESFLKAPRWNFDIIISYFLDIGMWTAFLGVYIICLVLKRRKSYHG